MADDKKLPAVRPPNVPAERTAYVSSPTQGRSLIGRAVSRFIAKLNTRTIEANTDELRALNQYLQEKGSVADAALDAERRIANYLHHRDDIIADDHEAHDDRMQENRHQRELNRRTRQETIRAVDAATGNAGVERDCDARILKAKKEAELGNAQYAATRATWGVEAFEQSKPHRKERIEHLYKQGALDEEIEMLIRETSRDDLRRKTTGDATSDAATLEIVDLLLSEVDAEIDTARATHASDEALTVLYGLRSRLSAKRSALKR